MAITKTRIGDELKGVTFELIESEYVKTDYRELAIINCCGSSSFKCISWNNDKKLRMGSWWWSWVGIVKCSTTGKHYFACWNDEKQLAQIYAEDLRKTCFYDAPGNVYNQVKGMVENG